MNVPEGHSGYLGLTDPSTLTAPVPGERPIVTNVTIITKNTAQQRCIFIPSHPHTLPRKTNCDKCHNYK